MNIPKDECVLVTYRTESQETRFVVTSKADDRTWFYLYEISDGKTTKLGKAHSPVELEKKFAIMAKLSV